MELDSVSKQLWFADDDAAAGSLQAVKQWWDMLAEKGPKYGYFVNPSKTVKKCQVIADGRCTWDLSLAQTT